MSFIMQALLTRFKVSFRQVGKSGIKFFTLHVNVVTYFQRSSTEVFFKVCIVSGKAFLA